MLARKILIAVLSITSVAGCGGPATEEVNDTPAPTTGEQQAETNEHSATYPIQDDAFYGVSPGEAIASLPAELIEKGELENGEGRFPVYYILAESGERIGYFYPDPNTDLVVGDIFVTTAQAVTQEGIQIGSSFEDIVGKIGDFEVHGSEVESRTHVFYGNLALQLDYPSVDYDLDSDAIPPDAKIVQIWIRRNAEGKS